MALDHAKLERAIGQDLKPEHFGQEESELTSRVSSYASQAEVATLPLDGADSRMDAATAYGRYLAFRDRALHMADAPSQIDRTGKGSVVYTDFGTRLTLITHERDRALAEYNRLMPVPSSPLARRRPRSGNVPVERSDW